MRVALALACCALGTIAGLAQNASPPNVIVILTDDQGYGDVGIHGNADIRTPHLDRFAREGIQLTRFYCNPVCSPTRASFLTGRHYYRTGVIHTSRGGAKMHGDEVTLAERLRDAGYATGIFGKWHLGDNYPMRPQDQGFDESLVHKSGGITQPPDTASHYFDPRLWRNGQPVQTQGYCTDLFTDGALDFIERHRERPFFVYLAYNAPHTPLEVAEKYAQPYREQGLNDTTARIYGMVENIDENVGRLLARLDALDLRRRTLVAFFTDNGPQQNRYNAGLRDLKTSTYEGGIRVPCFVQWPGRLAGERQLDALAAHIDLMPTILAACGVALPAEPRLDGVSLWPLLTGEAKEATSRTLFFQCHRGLSPQRYQNCAVVTPRYKLVGYPGTFGREGFAASHDHPVLELYDLQEDPGERRDLATQRPEVLRELRAAYDAWFDDVRSTRRFTPGVIRLGADEENPAHLCLYQDASWQGNSPQGWSVEVVRSGRYRVSVARGEKTPGRLYVNWQDKIQSAAPVGEDDSAVFELAAGRGVIDIWFQAEGQPRTLPPGNGAFGDATVERLP